MTNGTKGRTRTENVHDSTMTVIDNGVESVVRTIASAGGKLNSAVFRTASSQASDSLDRAIQSGRVRWVGFGGAVEIVPELVRETYIAESHPQAETVNPKPSKLRRPPYSPLTGLLPARIRQLSGRIIHWILNQGDQDAEGRPVCASRALERGLHASRLPEWTPAINLLIARKSIVIVGQEITVIGVGPDEWPDPFDPTGAKQAKEEKQARRRSRRKRPLSPWVRQKIAERRGEMPEARV